MACLRLFGPARDAAGVAQVDLPGRSIAEIIGAAEGRYGTEFTKIMACSGVWLNGEPVQRDALVNDEDEVAVIPPVSGG